MSVPANIMIVDDDPILRLVASEMLSQHGYAVSEAEDGEVALRKMALARPDLVILDMLMPNKEGIETIRDIKRRWPETKVIAISGGGKGLDTRYLLGMASALGADAVFEKPLRASGFVEIVQAALAGPPAQSRFA